MKHRSVRASRLLALVSSLLALAFSAAPPASAVEEGLQELRLPPLLVEQEIKADTGSELPPPTYPVQHVEQLPFHGAWHEFVNVTTGGLVILANRLVLPLTGTMSIEGHRQQFRNKQSYLRTLLKAADTHGCLRYRSDAWAWASAVEAPYPNPR